MRMRYSLLQDAITRGLHVYWLNCLDFDALKITDLPDEDTLDLFSKIIFGRGEKFRFQLVIISQSPIQREQARRIEMKKDMEIEISANRRLELAIPQIIPQDDLGMDYVNKWKKFALSGLECGKLEPVHMPARPFDSNKLYHYLKSGSSGVWFLVNRKREIAFLYSYQSVDISREPQAAEALAYLFDEHTRGYIRDVFFDHLLPYSKFVITDFIFTPQCHRWFQAEYNHAFSTGRLVYAIEILDKRTQSVRQIDRDEFDRLKPLYWGLDTAHQKYRFAIEQE